MIHTDAVDVFANTDNLLRKLAAQATTLASTTSDPTTKGALNQLAMKAGTTAQTAAKAALKVPVDKSATPLAKWTARRVQRLVDEVAGLHDGLSTAVGASAIDPELAKVFSDIDTLLQLAPVDVDDATSYQVSRLRSSVDDIASYPVLITETDSIGRPGQSSVTSGPARQVESVMREVLGRLPKYTDAQAFTAALRTTFELQSEAGHTVAVWRPRGFAGQGALGGSVSGAQASLLARAQDAFSAALPVLHGLAPLRPDPDPQEIDASRAILEGQFRSLVEELGTAGGPRVARVEALFNALLVDEVIGTRGRVIKGGMITYVEKVFGFQPRRVNTVEEEQAFSNFVLLKDYVEGLRTSWNSFLSAFGQKDLGTILVLLSNALQVVAESVDEVQAAMDSVFVGPSERGVTSFLTGRPNNDTMLVSEFLAWVSTFAATEAPALIQDGGRRAMGVVKTTASELARLTEQLDKAIRTEPRMPTGLRHPRVRHPLQELRSYIGQVVDAADRARTI